MTRQQRVLLGAGAVVLPVLLAPLLLRPIYAIGFACAAAGLALAARGVAWPLALSSLFSVLIGVLGHNPFPNGAIAKISFVWVLTALVIAVARDAEVLPGRVLLTAPLLLTILTAVWMTVRLGSSTDPQYGSFKLQLFVAENLAFLVAGIVVAARRDRFRLFLVLTLAMAGLSAIVLARGLASGSAESAMTNRLAISSDYNPIIFGRDAARAMTIAVFFLLVARLPWVRLVSIALLPLLAVAFTASGSRGPTVGLIVGLAVLLGLTLRDRDARRRVLLVFAGGVAGAFLVAQLVPGQNVSRALSFLTGNTEDASSNGRTGLWHAAWHAFTTHPLWGIGTGSFGSIDPVNLYPHNLVLETLSEQGIVGGLLVVGTIVLGAAGLWRSWRDTDGRDRHDAAMTASLFAAAVVNAMLSGDIAVNNAVWLALGLGLGLRLRARGLPAVPVGIAALRSRHAAPRERAGARQQRPAPERPAVGGRILEPAPGATLSGLVTAVVEPARTGRPVELVRLEWTTGALWVALAEADERTYELDVEGGGVIVRSRHAAELVADRLGADLAPSQRRPWSAWRRVELRFDAAGLESDGWLRAVSVDAGGVETPTEAVELSVAREAGAPAPASPAVEAPPDEPEPVVPITRPSRLTVAQLEAAIDANPSLSDERTYELEAVLYYLRDYAGVDGHLAPDFDELVEQEFGDLLGPRG